MRQKVARIILGECGDTGSDRHLCQVVMPRGAESLHHGSFSISLYQPTQKLYLNNFQADYSVRGEQILIVEPINAGSIKIYLNLVRSSDGIWKYNQGVVVTIRDGWLIEGSLSGKGKVIYDAFAILDKIIDAGGRMMEDEKKE